MFKKICSSLLLAQMVMFGYSQKNITKTNLLFGPFYKTFHIGQERLITDKLSVSTTMKFMLKRGLPNMLTKRLEVDGLEENPFLESKLSGIGNVTEARYYLKENMRGFYFGGFFSYMKYTVESGTFNGKFHDDAGVEYYADLKQKFKYGLGGIGIAIGVQGIIADHLVVDWTILGLGFGIGKLSGGIDATNTSANFDFTKYTSDITKYTYGLEDSWFLPVKKNVGQYNMELSAKAPFPILRTSLNIGLAY